MLENYTLIVQKEDKSKAISVVAHDSNHAQAQGIDISRALGLDRFSVEYSSKKPGELSELFRKLAFSEFSHQECFKWNGSFTNGSPVFYAFGMRYYVRNLILDYMDMNRDSVVNMSCKSKECINPYHFSYKTNKASKLTSGDRKLMLAFASQGVSVPQIAKALNVHRSTIYRNLKNEHFHARLTSH